MVAGAICCYSTSGPCCSFGLDFGDGLPPVLDLRFADDILSAKFSHEIMTLLDKLVQFLGDAAWGIRGTQCCILAYLESTRARSGGGMSHENMGSNLRF